MRISKNVVIVALKSRIFFTKRCFSSRLHRCVLWTKVLLRPPPPPVFDLRKCTTCMLRHSADLALCLIRPEASNCGALISHCLSSNVTHSLYIILGSATSGGFFCFCFFDSGVSAVLCLPPWAPSKHCGLPSAGLHYLLQEEGTVYWDEQQLYLSPPFFFRSGDVYLSLSASLCECVGVPVCMFVPALLLLLPALFLL